MRNFNTSNLFLPGVDAAAGRKSVGRTSHALHNWTMKSNPAYDMRDVESGKGQGNAMGDTAKYNVSGETSDLMATVRLGFIPQSIYAIDIATGGDVFYCSPF